MLSPARIAFTHIGCSVKKPLPVSQVEVGKLTVRTRLSSRVRIVEVAVLEVLMQDSCVRADSHHSVWRVDYHTLHVFDLAALQAVEVPDETRCESHAELAGDLAERFCLKWCEIQARQDLPEFTLQHVCGCTDANVLTIIPTNFTWALWDVEGAAAIETVDPDAASTLAMWTYGAAYRPKKSVWFGAGSLDGDGTQCPALATTVTINTGPKIPT